MNKNTDRVPRVTVAMPVYNAAVFLARTIESVLDQTLTDFEFLIIDDGSTDRSAEIVARFAKVDDRIRFRSRENRGGPATRNELTEIAQAPLLAVMDADDVCRPERLERQVAFLEVHPDIGMVGSHAQMIDEKDRPIMVLSPVSDPEGIDQKNLSGDNAILHPTVMLKTDILRQANGYSTDFNSAEDIDLWLRIGEFSRLANIPEVLLDYRVHGKSISSRDGLAQLNEVAEACRLARERRGLRPQPVTDKQHWRPNETRASQFEYALKWGWQSWKAGNSATARHFFLKAIRLNCLSATAWKAFLVASFRHPKG